MATIRTYRSDLKQSDNFIVENIENYLIRIDGLNVDYITDFQYIKPAHTITVKISKSQEEITNYHNPDYLALDEDDHTYYYFIDKIEWTSQNTLKYVCVMDVLNTFEGKYEFTDRSMIERQHMDRYIKKDAFVADDRTIVDCRVKRSRTDEQLTPKLYKISDTKVDGYEFNADDHKWYLVYRTSDLALDSSGKPVSGAVPCIDLVPDTGFYLEQSGTLPDIPGITRNWFTATITPTFFTNNKTNIYYIHGDDITVKINYTDDTGRHTLTVGTGGLCIMRYEQYRPGSQSYADGIRLDFIGADGKAKQYGPVMKTGSYDESYGITNIEIACQSGHKMFYNTRTSYDIAEIDTFPFFWLVGEGTYLTGLSSVNRTDSRIVKIIECPYCPINLTKTGETYTIPAGWSMSNESTLRTKDLTIKFERSRIATHDVDKYFNRQFTIYKTSLADPDEDRMLEPKIYNNATYKDAYVYDSNEYDLPIDEMQPMSTVPAWVGLWVDYCQSNAISSSLGFKFSLAANSPTTTVAVRNQETFGDIVLANRNNEIPVFTSEYLDYMKNGYNYDKEKLDRQAAEANVNIVKSAATAAATAAIAGALKGSTAGWVGAAVGGAIGLAAGVISANMSNQQAEADLQEKINEKANKAYAVSGSNDNSLFNWYSDNKLHHMVFQPDSDTLGMISQYYHLYGYNHGKYGKPNTNNRYSFNYVRGDMILRGTTFQPLEENMSFIRQKFQEGVYYIHNRVATPGDWDVKLATINVETALLPSSWTAKA